MYCPVEHIKSHSLTPLSHGEDPLLLSGRMCELSCCAESTCTELNVDKTRLLIPLWLS